MQKLSQKAGHRPELFWAGISALIFTLSLIVVDLCKNNPDLTEKIFTRAVYPKVMFVAGAIFSSADFSFAEVFAVLGVLLGVFAAGRTVVRGIGSRKVVPALLRVLLYGFSAASVLFAAFLLTGGLNYYRPPLTRLMGLPPAENITSQELYELSEALAYKTNAARARTSENPEGVFALSVTDKYELCSLSKPVFWDGMSAAGLYTGRYDRMSAPKPLLLSEFQTHMQILGVYSFVTGEPNVNTNVPDNEFPVTLFHEQSHLAGYMHEDEANFIAFLICRSSNLPDFEYSGYLTAFKYVGRALARTDIQSYVKIYDMLSPAVRRDLIHSRDFWEKYDTPVSDAAEKINDGYLKLNGTADGVLAYDRVTELLTALYRADGEI